VPLSGWAAIGWLAFLSSLAGYALWFLALERGGITRIAAWQFVQPVLTVTAAALLLDEPLTWQVAFAGLAIVGGTVIAYRHAR
jgi:drug/metabolite transporter (DMT)-like permease